MSNSLAANKKNILEKNSFPLRMRNFTLTAARFMLHGLARFCGAGRIYPGRSRHNASLVPSQRAGGDAATLDVLLAEHGEYSKAALFLTANQTPVYFVYQYYLQIMLMEQKRLAEIMPPSSGGF
jgi:hypothetical protein